MGELTVIFQEPSTDIVSPYRVVRGRRRVSPRGLAHAERP
jgi:hypothetical protein